MSLTTPKLIGDNSHDCKNCDTHVEFGRAISWEFELCPKCYKHEINKRESKINPIETVVNSAVINPMTLYLNQYTPREMENLT